MTLMTSEVIQRQLWRPFHKTIFKIVLKDGLGAGIGAWLSKGNTLKAITVVFSNEVCSTYTTMSSWTLLYEHVHVGRGNTWSSESATYRRITFLVNKSEAWLWMVTVLLVADAVHLETKCRVWEFFCFTVHFKSINLTRQLMHFYTQ